LHCGHAPHAPCPHPLISQARATVREVGYGLIQNWRSAHPGQAAAGADKAGPPAAAKADATLEELQGEAPGLLVQAAARAGAPKATFGGADAASGINIVGTAKRGATDVEPGSFLGLLLRARDHASGAAKFSDATITAQASTFILAGYEVGWAGAKRGCID
jgi:hypothetical protein